MGNMKPFHKNKEQVAFGILIVLKRNHILVRVAKKPHKKQETRHSCEGYKHCLSSAWFWHQIHKGSFVTLGCSLYNSKNYNKKPIIK